MENHNSGKKRNFFNSSSWKLGFALCVSLILLIIFRWYSYEKLAVILILPLTLILLFFALISFSWIIIYAIRNYKYYKIKVLLPIPLCLFAFYMIIFDPFFSLKIHLNFNNNRTAREAVVSEIRQERLNKVRTFNESYIASLPKDKEELSSDGEVLVSNKNNKLRVFFYTYRGVVDNFSGFIYADVPNDPSPKSLGCDPVRLEKKSDHWYWVSCT